MLRTFERQKVGSGTRKQVTTRAQLHVETRSSKTFENMCDLSPLTRKRVTQHQFGEHMYMYTRWRIFESDFHTKMGT